MATTVVLVLVALVVTVFEKCLRFVNMQRKVTKLSIHIRDSVTDRSTVLDFHQMVHHLPGPQYLSYLF